MESKLKTADSLREDDEVGVASRVGQLKKIIALLKRIHRSLSSDDMLLLLPSLEEVKLCTLIRMHLTSYIFLYHSEREGERSVLPRPTPEEGQDLDRNLQLHGESYFHKMLGLEEEDFHKSQPQPREWAVTQKLWDTMFELDEFHQLLLRRRSSITSSSRGGETHVVDPINAHLYHHLLAVLQALETMAAQRGFGPPEYGEEIACYKDIRMSMASIVAYAGAKYELLKISGGVDFESECSWFSFACDFPFATPYYTIIAPGHMIASAMEVTSELHSLAAKYRENISTIFSPTNNQLPMDVDVDDDTQDLPPPVQPHHHLPEEHVRAIRLDCLKDILSLSTQLSSLQCEAPPTTQELRYHLRIMDHIHASLWLTSENRLHGIDLTSTWGPDDDIDHPQSLPISGEGVTREEYLLKISNLVETLKFQSSATLVPTLKETKYYMKISALLNSHIGVMSKCISVIDKLKQPTTDKGMAFMKYSLTLVYKKELEFCEALKGKYARLVDVICSFVMPEEWEARAGTDTTKVQQWLEENKDSLLVKLESEPEKLKKLDQTIVILNGFKFLMDEALLQLCEATVSIDTELHITKRYGVVLQEVSNASGIV